MKDEKVILRDHSCPHCLAEEGRLHRWGCEHDTCPFCGAFGMDCDCCDDMVELAMGTAGAFRPACMTAEHEKRWLELVADLVPQRRDVLDSPFSEEDFYDECPPEWCRTDAQYAAYWKLQEEYMKLEGLLDRNWKVLCTEQGRLPQLDIPYMCALCGTLYPDLFGVPDEEWAKYVVPPLQKQVLCLDCYNRLKAVFPLGWRKAPEPGPLEKVGASRGKTG